MNAFHQTPHPILKPIPIEEIKRYVMVDGKPDVGRMVEIQKKIQEREETLKMAEENPLDHGFSFPQWDEADRQLHEIGRKILFVSGGNGSSKTQYGAKTVVECAMKNPNSTIFCFAQDWLIGSVKLQQKYIYRYLPNEVKEAGRTSTTYVKYSEKNGFTGGSCILPNGSEIIFATYSQFVTNRAKFEGTEVGSREASVGNLGIWFDEYLESGDLFDTMVYRLARRNASILLTFTPIDGHTPFVADLLKDSQVVKTRPTHPKAMPNEGEPKVVDFVRINEDRNLAIIFFAAEENPWGGFDSLVRDNKHKDVGERLTRFYGIPVKSMTTIFPLFNTTVHVTDEIPKLSPETHTIYHVVDPASARNYVSIWAAVDQSGHVSVLREWPDRETHGPWAEFGDPKWKFGPASKKLGYNVKGYADLFNEIEEELGITDQFAIERIGDSRFFATEDADNVDLFTAFSEHGLDFIPSDGRHEDMGIAKIDEYFHYNPNVEVDAANTPLMDINEKCGNLIYAVLNYGQNGKKDEPLKDFPDTLRYLCMANCGDGPDHYSKSELTPQSSADGGY